MCTPSANGECFDPCTPWNEHQPGVLRATRRQMFYDGNPLFFPIDDAPNALNDMRYRAKIPEEYGYNGWPWEDAVFPGAPMHNFHFTTEVVYWFKYDDKTLGRARLHGRRRRLGVRQRQARGRSRRSARAEQGTVTLDARSGAKLRPDRRQRLRDPRLPRRAQGRRLVVQAHALGFNTSPSDCTPICGDGIVTAGEECDDGINDGGYEECAPGCVLGPRCGDGIVQEDEKTATTATAATATAAARRAAT